MRWADKAGLPARRMPFGARRMGSASRPAARNAATAEAGLDRARAAVEDRSGPAREEARQALNRASVAAGQAGAAADAAWAAWQKGAVALLAATE